MEEDTEYKKLPIEERVVHKLWKARVHGYEELTKLFRQIDDEKSPEFGKYLGLVKKFVIDSNAMGQEKGLEATLAFVENYANAGKTVGEVMSGIVSKCIAAPKTKTRELAVQITLMYVEIEKQDAVQEELMKGMDLKNPKIVSACISTTTLALKEFGSKVVNVKPLIKKMPALLADRDKSVREETKAMVVEIYRWIGGALKTQLTNLPAVQLTELETEFNKLGSEKVTPIRYLRSQQQKQAKIAAESGDVDEAGDDDEVDATPDVDPYDLADPINILAKLPADIYEKFEAKKWQERKEAVEVVENLVKAPKLENGDYGDLVRALKKIIAKDSNVMVVAISGKCLAGLANGLKKRFQPYASSCVPVLLEKFREKKQNVVTALREALDAIFVSTTLETITEDVLEALNNKNPSVKTETALFLARSFTKCQPTALNKKLLKAYTVALLKTLNESDQTVRDSSAEALGTLMKLVGEKAIAPFVVEVDNLKMTKIKECCDKAVIIVKSVAPKKERAAASSGGSSSASSTNKSGGSNAPKPVKRPTTGATNTIVKKKSGPSSTTTTASSNNVVSTTGGGGGVRSKSVKSTQRIIEQEMTAEEIESKASELFDVETLTMLADTNWKNRLGAVEKFQTTMQQIPNGTVSSQVLVGTLTRKPGLKDTNIQVLKARLEALKIIAETQKISSVSVNLCVNDVTDKLGDTKTNSLASDVLTAMSEGTKLDIVAGAVLEYAFNQKNPKVQQESLLWVSNAIKEFGFVVNPKSVIEVAKKGVAAINPIVRTAAISLLGVLYMYMGVTLHAFFENEKPALKQQIDAEFNKYENEKPPEPIRGVSKQQQQQKSSSIDNLDVCEQQDGDCADDDTQQPAFNPQDLIPRQDISVQITDALISELGDKNWKVRIETLQKVHTLLDEVKYIHPNIGDLPLALSQRLVDSNGKIVQMAIQICQMLVTAIGPPCKQHIRLLFPGLLQALSDNKNWIRAASTTCINTWGDTCGYKEFFDGEMIGDALKTGSPTLRSELWGWLAEKLEKLPLKSIPKEELTICIPILYQNLEDRSPDVRKTAQEAVLPIMIHLGYELMVKQTEKLKPGSRTVVMALLDKARPNLPAKPLPPAKTKQIGSADSASRNKVPTSSSNASANNSNKVDVGAGGAATAAGGKGLAAKGRISTVAGKSGSGRKKEEDIDMSPLLVANNLKNQRVIDEQKLKVLKWNFTTPREEFVELLKDQMMTANVNKTLLSNMFHIDFRYHLKAIESLMDDVHSNSSGLIANLDLILKWLTLRFFDTNPSVLLKGLEYLQIVFGMLIEKKHALLENEASSFIPYLILKIGDPKDAVRNGVKALFRQITEIYHAPRLFAFIMEGLKSKNARQRTECLDELSTLIDNYQMAVCQPSPGAAMKEIAKHISDRDNSVRNAALNCIVAAYFIEGEKIHKMIGQISDKDHSLLEERIKRAKKAPRQSRIIVPPQHSQQLSPQGKEHTTVLSGGALNATATVGAGVTAACDDSSDVDQQSDEEHEIAPPLPVTRSSPPRHVPGPFRLDPELLHELEKSPIKICEPSFADMDLAFLEEPVPTLAEIYKKAETKPSGGKPVIESVPMKPSLIGETALIGQYSTITRPSSSASTSSTSAAVRGQELIIEKTINQIASPDLKVVLSATKQMEDMLRTNKCNLVIDMEDQFMAAITLQLKLLHSQSLNSNPDVLKTYRSLLTILSTFYENKMLGRKVSKQALKAILQQLILLLVDTKLENVESSDAYNRVINLQCVRIIEKSDHTNVVCALISLLHECVGTSCSPRFLDLVMKCLWRVIKIVPTWQDELEYDTVLYEIHLFFKDYPSVYWKSRPTDTPNRTVKTILHSMAKIKGNTLMMHLGKIQNPAESELQAYLLKLLKTIKLEEVKQIPLKKEKRPISKQLHNQLTEIFQKIGAKEATKEGLTLLYDFKIQHPETDLQPYLEKSTQFFQEYIERGLKDIEKSRKKDTMSSASSMTTATITTTTTTNNVNTVQEQFQQLQQQHHQYEHRENIQPNRMTSNDGKTPDYWMERLKMWKSVLNNSRSSSPSYNMMDNNKDENLNLQKTTNVGDAMEQDIHSTGDVHFCVEAVRKQNEMNNL